MVLRYTFKVFFTKSNYKKNK